MKYIIVNLIIFILLNLKYVHVQELEPLPRYIPKDKCVLRGFNLEFPPLFLDKTNPKNITFIRYYTNTFAIDDDQIVLVLCPGGMQFQELNSTVKQIKLKCVNSTTQGITDDGISIQDISNLTCPTSSRYEIFQKVGYGSCAYNYYAIGVKIMEEIYEFAQICFDLRAMRPMFIRYYDRHFPLSISDFKTDFALDNGPKWWEMDERYKGNIQINAEENRLSKKTYIDLVLPSYNFFIPTNKYQELTKQIFKCHSEIVDYHSANLFGSYNYPKYIDDIFKDDLKVQSFVGWDTLVFGNWELYLSLLHNRTTYESTDYETFMGTSHIAQFPNFACAGEERQMILKDNGKEVAIPQYVWSFLRNTEEKYVIVGVNTPYYPVYEKSNPLPCVSTCVDIEWLKPLVKIFTVSTFGLMYCCNVNDVEGFLDGFPNV